LQRTGTGPGKKPFPWLIQQFLARCDWLYTDRKLFPELGERKRSERIEAMVLVVKGLGRHLDRLTLRCGSPNGDGTFTGITMKTIAGWAGIKRQRAFRALWDLREAGYVELHQPIDHLPDGRRRGLAGIRRVTRNFFARLDLAGRLRREQKEHWKAEHARQTVQTIAQRRQLRRLFRASQRAADLTARTTSQLAGAATPPPPRPSTTVDEIAQKLAAWRARQTD
jgi:hypothetical protein